MPILILVIVAILAFNVLFVAVRLHASRSRPANHRAAFFRSPFDAPNYATLIAKEYPRPERASSRQSTRH